jgi:hypothetical protein
MKGAILLLLLLAGCAVQQSPGELLSGEAAQLKTACNAACQGTPTTIQLSLLENASLYTTAEAICIKQNSRLFCGTCPCTVENVTLPAGLQNYSCTLTPAEDMVTLTCA